MTRRIIAWYVLVGMLFFGAVVTFGHVRGNFAPTCPPGTVCDDGGGDGD
jgi:hypothetical protein